MRKIYKSSVFVSLLFALLSIVITQSAAQSAPITEDEYWQFVQESRQQIESIKNAELEEQQIRLTQLASEWQAITQVEVEGQNILVNHQYLIRLMQSNPPNLDALDDQLASFFNLRLVPVTGTFTNVDIAPLREILARPEFQWNETTTNPFDEWLQKILTEINRWLNNLANTFGFGLNPDITGIILSIFLLLIFIFIFRTILSDFSREAKQLDENNEEMPLTSEAAFAKAQQLSRGGDYRTAVRYLYLSTLLIMDERGVIRYDRSKTNREYLRSVSNSPELSKPLEEVIEVFDEVWYGYHDVGEEKFNSYSKRVEELKEKQA